jgi:hypothetical protein
MLDLTHDRCDRCGARAIARARKPGTGELFFCEHHRREHEEALLDNLWLVESEVQVPA